MGITVDDGGEVAGSRHGLNHSVKKSLYSKSLNIQYHDASTPLRQLIHWGRKWKQIVDIR